MMPAHIDALDRLHEVTACYRAVEALSIPCEDTHILSRDDLATLLGLLNRLNAEALAALTRAETAA